MMEFNEIYKQFIRPTKNNFPIEDCIQQDKKEKNVFISKNPYLCLTIDRRFNNYWQLIILYPYICKESDDVVTFGWLDKSRNIFCNIENSTQLWDEFVIGFQRYESSKDDELWKNLLQDIDKQFEE